MRKLATILTASAMMLLSCGPKPVAVEYKTADNPLFVDPVYNGSTDPMVCYNPVTGTYYMYYTSRRSNVQGLGGIESIHGCPIGMAESRDGGATWEYIGDAVIDYAPDENPTYWAPEVIYANGKFHMYLTYVPGIFDNWDHPRDIVHLTSDNGREWHTESVLDLAVRKVIDACVAQLPDGTWRLWYNNEPDGKTIFYADSEDLYNWTDKGKVTSIVTAGEGPNVFNFKGKTYMIVDEWKGLSVFTTDDYDNWTKQDGAYLINGENGQDRGNHADVEVVDGHAYMFYFTNMKPVVDTLSGKRIFRRGHEVHVTELFLDEQGRITCDTTLPCQINLMADKSGEPVTETYPVHVSKVWASDPFIYADETDHTYYMYQSGGGGRVNSRASKDLVYWTQPFTVMEFTDAHWAGAKAASWASEVHKYKGKYYLFTTSHTEEAMETIPGRCDIPHRATQIYVADSPRGPFKDFTGNRAHTPDNWAALDGTLWIEDGTPYMIFCHEWLQAYDGTMELVKLPKDLGVPSEEPVTLFKASDAKWVKEMLAIGNKTNGLDLGGYVTDGPWIFRTDTGKLGMLWSSWYGHDTYAIAAAYSQSGSVKGPWIQEDEPIYGQNGGHGMLFRTFDGKLKLSMHYVDPADARPMRKPVFKNVDISGDKLVILD